MVVGPQSMLFPGGKRTGTWHFTGHIRDEGRFDRQCPVCRKDDLRVTYEVRQASTGSVNLACFDCVSQDLEHVQVDGCPPDVQSRRDYLGRLAVKVTHQTCRTVIRHLMLLNDDPTLQEVAVYFDRNGQLSPGHAAKLFVALSCSALRTDVKIFDVQIRSIAHKREFSRLSDKEKLLIWPVFSPAIRNKLTALHFGPRQRRSEPAPKSKEIDGEFARA